MNAFCSICTEPLDPQNELNITQCGHLFHFLCLEKWLEGSAKCPQCSSKSSISNTFRVYLNAALNETTYATPVKKRNELQEIYDVTWELRQAKQLIHTMENVNQIIKSTPRELDAMLKVPNKYTIRMLCTIVAALKHERGILEAKGNDLRNILRRAQKELQKLSTEKWTLKAKIEKAEIQKANAIKIAKFSGL